MSYLEKSVRKRIKERRRVLGDHDAFVTATRTKKKVLLVVHGHLGEEAAVSGINLDDEATTRLARRLLAIVGGKAALK